MSAEQPQDLIGRFLGNSWKSGVPLAEGDFVLEGPMDFSNGAKLAPVKIVPIDLGDRCLPVGIRETQENDQGSITEIQIYTRCFPDLIAIPRGRGVGLLLGFAEEGVAQVEAVASATWSDEVSDVMQAISYVIAKAYQQLAPRLASGLFPFKIIGIYIPDSPAYKHAEILGEIKDIEFIMDGQVVKDQVASIDTHLHAVCKDTNGTLHTIPSIIPVDEEEDE